MSRRKTPSRALLVLSVLFRDERRYEEIVPRLVETFGEPERVSDPLPFDRTDYYEREMGAPLVRRFVVFRETVPRDALAGIKARAEALETASAEDGRRTVNLDPGLLTDENFVLATGKNFSHRVYLGDGVFAELALMFRRGAYRPLPWTYPDYASDTVRRFLAEVRSGFRDERRRGEESHSWT